MSHLSLSGRKMHLRIFIELILKSVKGVKGVGYVFTRYILRGES